ncbi:Integrin alpha-9 [Fukomys damarensis]|uniref:Integrin alpha-9 n=1 Tax=Fukomys damarensis TaxID=885580 RepID=A0A091DHC7_FUKDA|nr:Integrin alpha-9 [Fukomys damarensis]
MFSEIRFKGQVTIYINTGNGALEKQLALTGDRPYNVHFGETIFSLGDLDDDGFSDVATGASKVDNIAGAVYVYHGYAGGVVPQQKINPVMQMFGQSISGGIYMDGNGCPDFTTGAFMSDSMVLLRASTVIMVDISTFLLGIINITVPCRHVPEEIGLNCVLMADVDKKEKGQLPGVYFVLLGETVGQVLEKLQLAHMEGLCHCYVVHMKQRVQDVISLIMFEAAYSLRTHVTGE